VTGPAGVPEESWEGWTRRVAADLGDLPEGGWLTFTVHADAAGATGGAADPTPPRRPGLFRRGGRPEAAPTADVFVQVSRLEGVLALECIADPEFEGLTALTAAEFEALRTLGWELVDDEADLARVLPPDAVDDAASLVTATLRDVLRAPAPSAVDRRHA
jgi:hypothetical protein